MGMLPAAAQVSASIRQGRAGQDHRRSIFSFLRVAYGHAPRRARARFDHHPRSAARSESRPPPYRGAIGLPTGGAAQCDILDCPPPRRYRPDSAHRREIDQRNREFLEAMRVNPAASAAELAAVLKISKSALVGRQRRLGREGALVQCRDGRWRLPTSDDRLIDEIEERSEFEVAERSPSVPAFDPTRWVQHVDFYLVWNSGPFACRRYG